MEFALSADDLAFREEVRSFLKERLTPELREAGARMTSVFIDKPWSIAWQKILHEKGWVAPDWPVEHDGTGWTETQRYIFASECALASAPALAPQGLNLAFADGIHSGNDARIKFGAAARRGFAGDIGAGGHQCATEGIAQCPHQRVRRHAHGDAVVRAGDPMRCIGRCRHDPRIWPRPAGAYLRKLCLAQWRSLDERRQLGFIAGDQDQAFGHIALLERQQSQYRRFVVRIAAQTPHAFGGVGNHAALAQ